MLNFFDTIADYLAIIWNFVSNLVNSFTTALLLISQIPTSLATILGFLPGIIATSLMIVVAIGTLKLVLGWGNS